MKNKSAKLPHLERLILILEAVAHSGAALSTAEICAATRLPSPTVYRLIKELADSGMLQVEDGRRFTIGARLKRIALPDHADFNVCLLARPMLIEAANQHGAAFFLSRSTGDGVEIIHVEIPQDDRVSYLHPGLGFRPLHACSCAKAVAAFSNNAALKLALNGRLRAYTQYTRTDVRDVEAELEQIRQKGYAECIQEMELGMCSVAAPVFEHNKHTALSIGATGSLRLFTDEFRHQLGRVLIGRADDLSGRLAATLRKRQVHT